MHHASRRPFRTIPHALAALLAAVLLAVVAPPSPAQAGDAPARKEIAIGLCDYYPPFYRRLDSGKWKGVFIDFLHAFEAEHPEYAIRLVPLPRKRMDTALSKGKVDAYGLTSPIFIPVDKHPDYLFSAPMWRMCDHVAVRADDPFEYTGPESLADRPLGLILGNGYGPLDPLLRDGTIKAERLQGGPRLIRMLLSGRVDRVVLNDVTERTAMRRMGIPAGAVRFLDPPLYCFDLCVQVRREQAAFLDDITAFIDEARARGLLDIRQSGDGLGTGD